MAKLDAWGVEVGSDALKAIKLVRDKDAVQIADYDVIPFKKVLGTPDVNADDAIQVNLDQFMSKHELGKTPVLVSVPGHAAFARFAKLPPVDPKKIPEIVHYEAMQQIPFPMNQVVWDYQVFREEDMPDVEVGIFAMTKERIVEVLNNYRAVGMDVHGMTLSPLALYNAMAFDMDLDGTSEGVIFVDIGTQSTDMIIVERGRIWMRTLAIGGNTFTDALVKSFKLSFPKAEKLKREAGTSKYARQIFQAMRPVFADLVQEMQRSLGFYQSLNRDSEVSKVIGVGSTFKLPGLIKFLKQQLQMEVLRPEKFNKIAIEGKQEADFAEHVVNLGTAYGLALQGIELERVNANLLPVNIHRARIWKAKQWWFGAAAASMVVATGAAYYKLASDQATYAKARQQSEQVISRVKAKGDELKGKLDSVARTDPRHRIENLRRILDYRDIWPKLMEDLSLATRSFKPQPDLLTEDYEAIRRIPRERRQQMFISKVSATYRIRSDPNEGAKATGELKSTPSDNSGAIWGADAAPSKAADAAAIDEELVRRATGPNILPQKGPEFIIQIEGTTPYADGLRYLEERFLGWLKDHHEQVNRPYRIVATKDALLYVQRDAKEDKPVEKPDAGAVEPGAPGVTPSVVPSIVPTIVPSIVAPAPAEDGGGREGPARGDAKESSANIALPERPLADEQVSSDWRFTVVFYVQVIRPEAVRRREAELIEKQKKQAQQEENATAEEKPGDAKPGDTKPGDAKPGDAKSGEVKPADAKPSTPAPANATPPEPAK